MIVPKVYCSCGEELEIQPEKTHGIGQGKIVVSPCFRCTTQQKDNDTCKCLHETITLHRWDDGIYRCGFCGGIFRQG